MMDCRRSDKYGWLIYSFTLQQQMLVRIRSHFKLPKVKGRINTEVITEHFWSTKSGMVKAHVWFARNPQISGTSWCSRITDFLLCFTYSSNSSTWSALPILCIRSYICCRDLDNWQPKTPPALSQIFLWATEGLLEAISFFIASIVPFSRECRRAFYFHEWWPQTAPRRYFPWISGTVASTLTPVSFHSLALSRKLNGTGQNLSFFELI